MAPTNFDNLRNDELLTVIQIMDYLKVCRATVQRWCKEGKLPAVKIGKEYRCRWGDLKGWYNHLLEGRDTDTGTQEQVVAPIALVPQPTQTGRRPGRPAGRQANAG